ncbi:acyl-CoA dehydrogenase family protein [Dietzia kunjamensis]|uniref:acyl-CoA dehydrogenase family protein n=1 Tax=Dietzia kunjamensis TaxID=322509 RepID=UPI0032AEABB6
MTTTLFPDHRPTWQTESHELLRDHSRAFFAREVTPRQADWARQGHVDRELWNRAGAAGLLLTDIADEDGGGGGDFGHEAVVAQELAYAHDSSFGFTVHSTIVSHYINAYGTEEQKRRWLPSLASGEKVVAVAMTEPGTGSDLQNVKTTAIRDGDHYLVNGAKTFISNGTHCDLVVIVAKTDPAAGGKGISLLVAEVGDDVAGFSRGAVLEKIGMHGWDTRELFFDDMRVPVENLLGEEGAGFAELMTQLPRERLIIGVSGVAVAEAAVIETIRYVKERDAFGKKLLDFQNTQFVLAECKAEVYAGKALIDDGIRRQIDGTLDAAGASMIKMWATDMQCRVVDKCLQLFGGYGYMMEYPIAQMYAASRVQRIYGGTNEIMKLLVARSL